MAPIIKTTKLVATAIATFVSTDKVINSPFVFLWWPLYDPALKFSFLIASNFDSPMDATIKR
jgi:hypothetical protein